MTDVGKYRNKKKRLTLSVAYLQLSKMRTNTVKAINDANYCTPKAHRDKDSVFKLIDCKDTAVKAIYENRVRVKVSKQTKYRAEHFNFIRYLP